MTQKIFVLALDLNLNIYVFLAIITIAAKHINKILIYLMQIIRIHCCKIPWKSKCATVVGSQRSTKLVPCSCQNVQLWLVQCQARNLCRCGWFSAKHETCAMFRSKCAAVVGSGPSTKLVLCWNQNVPL